MRAALLFISLCLIPGAVLCFGVSGCSGGSVMFKCLYSSLITATDQPEMYFCRRDDCTTGISSKIQRSWVSKGRFSLYVDESGRFFTVFIRNLSREDHGEYTCGNNQSWSHSVELQVNNGSRCGISAVRFERVGQTVTLRCGYDHGFETHAKLLYRLEQGDPVLVLNSSSQSSKEKISLSDDHSHHFNVTIRGVSQEDGGVYLCALEGSGSDRTVSHVTFVKEIHLNVSSQITSVLLQAYSGESVFIKCKFPEEFRENSKFFQKGESQKIFTDRQDEWERRDKVNMYDDTRKGLLKLLIRDLSTADEDTYRCGVRVARDQLFTDLELRVNEAPPQAPADDHVHSSSKVYGVFGERVNVTCRHEMNNLTVTHICKQEPLQICRDMRSSGDQRLLFPDSPAGVFSVSISNVSIRDAGVYWCGAETTHTYLTFISLRKLELTLTMPPVIGREGASVEIRCPHESKEVKFLCKGKCFVQDAQTVVQSDRAQRPRFSFKDERELFTVTVSDLRAKDAGIYWCAVKNTNYEISTDLLIVTRAALVVHEAVGGSASISCKHNRSQTVNRRSLSFCRGDRPDVCVRTGVLVSFDQNTRDRFSLTDRTSPGAFTVNISNLTTGDSGKYWCAVEASGSFILTEVHLNVSRGPTSTDPKKAKPGVSLIVVGCVGSILLAVCVTLLLLKQKCGAKRGSSSDGAETGNDVTAPEETPVTPLHSPSPTIPSDGLVYATVSFQKHEERLGDVTVAFSEDDTRCEYASVNHRIKPDE